MTLKIFVTVLWVQAERQQAGSQSQMFSSVRDSHKSHSCRVYPPEWSQRENKHPQTAADMTRKLGEEPFGTSLAVFPFICRMCRGASANQGAARLLCWNFNTEYLESVFSFSSPLCCGTKLKLCLANQRATLTYSVLYSLQQHPPRPFRSLSCLVWTLLDWRGWILTSWRWRNGTEFSIKDTAVCLLSVVCWVIC